MPDDPRVAVVGAGAWGTTLAAILARKEPVTLVCRHAGLADAINATHRNERRLPGIDLPEALLATSDPAAVRGATELVIIATPSSYVRSTVASIASSIPPSADVL
jgi:glycerol-3-phosphate dehydrogenase (NAD(P)+)